MEMKVKTSDLFRKSMQIHRKNGVIAYLITILTVALACGFMALNLLFSSFFIFTVPLIIIPLFFACQAAVRLMRNTSTLTLKGYLSCFAGYFSEHFNSTYRVIRSMLFSLIFFGGCLLTSITVAIPCFYAFNYFDFKTFVDTIPLYSTSEAILEHLNTYARTIEMIFIYTAYPSLMLFSFVFLFLADKNSTSLFFRLDKRQYTGRYISTLNDIVIKNNKKAYYKSYISLNWPFYLLFILGVVLGFYLGSIYSMDYSTLFTFSIIGGLLVSFIIYGPMLYANKEAIYDTFKDAYDVEDSILQNHVTNSIQDLIKTMNEMRDEKKDSNES